MPRSLPLVAWDQLLDRFSKWCSIERMNADRAGALCAFFKRAYADQPTAWAFRDDECMLRRWRWLNEGNPIPFDGGIPAWVGVRNGQIVGHFALLPVLAVGHGRAMPICWGRDLIVAPEARQLGVGPLLVMTAVRAARQPICVAGLNEAAYALYDRLGFVDGGRIPLYVKAYQPDRLLETLPWPWPARRGLAAALKVAHWLADRWKRPASPLRVMPIEAFDERFDRWWRDIEGRFSCIVRRTSGTMAWRYLAHPEHRYHVAVAIDERERVVRGVVVVRHGRSRGLPVGFISEVLADPDDKEALAVLLAYAEEYLTSTAVEPMAFLRCTILHQAFERALVRAGFLPMPSPIRWMMAHADGPSGIKGLVRLDEWFLSAGDSDLDML